MRVCVYFSSGNVDFKQDFKSSMIYGNRLRVTSVARVWPFRLVLGVSVSKMLVSG